MIPAVKQLPFIGHSVFFLQLHLTLLVLGMEDSGIMFGDQWHAIHATITDLYSVSVEHLAEVIQLSCLMIV